MIQFEYGDKMKGGRNTILYIEQRAKKQSNERANSKADSHQNKFCLTFENSSHIITSIFLLNFLENIHNTKSLRFLSSMILVRMLAGY